MANNDKADQPAGPADRLKAEAISLVGALGDRAMASLRGRIQETAGRLTDYVEDGAGPGLMAAVTGAKDLAEGKSPVRALFGAGAKAVKQGVGSMFGGGKGGGKGKNLKVTNIVETIDVGAPLRLTYDLWTQFADFPSFMKKVESVEQQDEAQRLNWKAQVLWSHRTWEATILEQAPDDKIIWRSKGAKGHVDGAVTFHEVAPNLTRIILVLEYYPQGLFEHTGNIWRAQGRRARLELKHFRRHIMTEVLLHPDEVEGWRGVIKDGEVVQEGEEEAAGQEAPAADDDEELQDEDENKDEDDKEGGAERADRRRAGRGGRQPSGRTQPRSKRPRDGRSEDRPSTEDRPRRVTRRAASREGARS